MAVSFTTFPLVPAENNIFYHTGNPDLSAFTCDVSTVTPADVTCTIADETYSNIKGGSGGRHEPTGCASKNIHFSMLGGLLWFDGSHRELEC